MTNGLDPQTPEGTARDGQSRLGITIKAAYTCPRCGHLIPNDDEPGAYPGAMSRADNTTEVCSICGTDEAFGTGPVPVNQWPITLPDSVYADAGARLQREQVLALLRGESRG